jgi:hypothetical protein
LLEQAISHYARLLPATASESSSADANDNTDGSADANNNTDAGADNAVDEDERSGNEASGFAGSQAGDETGGDAGGKTGGKTDSNIANDAALLTALGVALSAPGIATALAYAIHARFPVEKERCSVILLPRVVEKLVSVRPEKVAKVAAMFGENTEGLSVAEAANTAFTTISQRLTEKSAPATFRELNLVLDRLIPIAETARNLEFITYSPWTITSEEVFELLKQTF